MTLGKRWLMLISGLLALLSGAYSWGQNTEQSASQSSVPLIEQLKFAAVEVLVYTDQLRRFEGTRCRTSVLSNYDIVAAQQRLLAQLNPLHRQQFEQLFSSAQIKRLLTENGSGIEAMLGPQQLLGGGEALNAEQQAACRELGSVFQDNYLQSQADLQQLLSRYQR